MLNFALKAYNEEEEERKKLRLNLTIVYVATIHRKQPSRLIRNCFPGGNLLRPTNRCHGGIGALRTYVH